jgi:excisionase family DNA binding protein
MEFDIYFPLFEEVMHGGLNPELPKNAEGYPYVRRVQEQVVAGIKPVGMFSLHYAEPINQKCLFYKRLLLSETHGYCEDVLAYLSDEKDERIRSYYRDQILDKHLTTCLMRLGEKMEAANYRFDELIHHAADADQDRLSNIYIFHLLKACLAKAYLEVQESLSDVVRWKLSEEMLYTTLVREKIPVQTFLRKKGQPVAVQDQHKRDMASKNNAAKGHKEEMATQPVTHDAVRNEEVQFLDVKQVCALLHKTENTVYRRIQKGEIKAIKEGKTYLIEKQAFEKYLDSLRIKSPTKK